MIKIHVENQIDNLFAPELLFPMFVFPDAILRLKLPKKTTLPYYQLPLLYIWGEKDHI
jgi:hypothetical protein